MSVICGNCKSVVSEVGWCCNGRLPPQDPCKSDTCRNCAYYKGGKRFKKQPMYCSAACADEDEKVVDSIMLGPSAMAAQNAGLKNS